MRFYGLDQVAMPTAAFQKAAKEILATYGGGGVVNPNLSDFPDPTKGAFVAAGTALLLSSAFSALAGIYMFRHTKDEKNTFWKVIGYVGGTSSMLAAITLLLGSVASTASALPATQGQQ